MTRVGEDDRQIDSRGRRTLLSGLVAAAGAAAAKPAAALEQATRTPPTHQNILDHLDDII